MDYCLIVAPWLCSKLNDEFHFWEVGVTAFVAVLTIVVSLGGAWVIARFEARRDHLADQQARRVEAIAAFGDLGATVLIEARKGDGTEFIVHSYQYMSRISVHTRAAEAGMHDWMRASADTLVGMLTSYVQAGPAASPDDLDAAIDYYRARMEDLRAWPSSREAWDDYIADITPRS